MNYRCVILLSVSVFNLGLVGCAAPSRPDFSLPEGVNFIDAKSDLAAVSSATAPVIAYQKYRLDNGLTVILHPDNSDPLVHVDMTYHVGSAREELGKSGFAHFFEHMMFQGSEHVAEQMHFKLVTEAGGSLNGSTNRDRTNYYQTVPANQLEKVLWLESDRMGFLLNAVTEKKFEIQRDTVKNERAQNYENRPYGLVYPTLDAALYPPEHPYSWPTIGYVSDLDRVNVNDLKDFFLRWYGPNNATLTIGGAIDPAQTLRWVKKYFGEIPAGPAVNTPEKWPVTLEKNRFVTLEDKIQQPMLMMAWPATYPDSEVDLALNLLAAALGQGRNSLFYQELVKKGEALSAQAYQSCGELACSFQLYVLGNQGQSLGSLYQKVQGILLQLKQQGLPKELLEQVKGVAIADAVFSLESVQGKVSQLASNQTFYASPDKFEDWFKSLERVTEQQIMAAFAQYIWQKPAVILSVVPQGNTKLAVQPANFSHHRPDYAIKRADKLALRTTPVSFDRSHIPAPAPAVAPTIPTLYRTRFANGIELVGTVSRETPTVTLHLLLPAGNLMAPAGKNGLAPLTAALMQEGSLNRSSEQLASALDKLGSSISFNAGATSTIMSISSLRQHLDQTLALAADMLFSPRFDEADFTRVQNQMIESAVFSKQDPSQLANNAVRNALYQDSWRKIAPTGSEQTLRQLTLDDVKTFYRNHYTPQNAALVAVGDISKQSLITKLQPLNHWQGQASNLEAPVKLRAFTGSKIWLVDSPNAPQSVVQFVRPAMPYDATGEMFKTQLANFNFAGNFNSRLNLNLREDKGLTYGVTGKVVGTKDHGYLLVSTQVRADSTAQAINEIRAELKKITLKGITKQELEFMRQAVSQQEALAYETPAQKAGMIAQMLRYQLPADYTAQQQRIIETIDQRTLNQVAMHWFDPNAFQIVVVGDAKRLAPELSSLGLEIETMELN